MKKSCKKGHPAGRGKRWLALLLSLCLVGTMTPVSVRAEAGSTANGLCEHHTEHTPECGYAEVSGGDSCTFVCDSCGAGAEPEEPVLSGAGQAGAEMLSVTWRTGFDMTGQPSDAAIKTINLNAAVLRPSEADGKKWDAANGNKVYFGSYNSNPLAYRVLSSPNTQGSSESYLLLDCDTLLEKKVFSVNSNNKWTDSTCTVRNWLNGTDFYDASVFSTPEKTAIAETALAEQSQYTVGYFGISYEDYSAQNYVFCLSAAEADGLYANEDSRKKTGVGDNYWWLRSANSNFADAAGGVNSSGRSNSYPASDYCGVSPALNVDLSKVLFASVSGQSASGEALDKTSALAVVSDSAAKQWKLTLLDSSKTVKVTDGQSVTRQGATVTVPYTYSGSDVTQISVMITDYPYTDRYDAQVLYYGALQDVNISNISGTGTFDLPTNLNENYFAYIIAEDVNGNTESDYASAPVQITIPAGTILTEISSVDIAGFEAPAVNTALGAAASCTTTGVSSAAITWSPAASIAGYNTSYTASITLSAEEGYEFTDTTAATVLGKEATSVAKNADGTLTVTYTFPATAKDNNAGKEPSVSAYATKEQMMGDTFAPNSDGVATNYGKLVFGKNSSGNAQEWYILGKDTGVTGDNTIIFATSPIATNQVFNSSTYSKTYNYDAGTGYGDSAGGIEVYANHYGASDLRVALKGMADGSNTSYFTTAEQGLMNATTVTTNDTKNGVTYTTTDKLYALQGDYANNKKLWAGTSDSTVLAMSSYWNSGSWFWLRSPYVIYVYDALLAIPGSYVDYDVVINGYAVQPASNLSLSSVLFASAATAASSDTVSNTIASETAMSLRLDGTGKNIGTVTYNTTTGDIKADKGSTSQTVALVVQGNDGANDWFYSKQITGPETINASAIKTALSMTSDIDLSACKIWLETTDSTENLTYAVNATEAATSNITSVAITDIDTPAANTALDTSASCTTTGVSSTTPQITWTPNDTTAGYNTSYTASITLTADTDYEFADTVTATVSGNNATSTTKNADGTLTVTYTFPATAKDKLVSITPPQAMTVTNGTSYEAMNLPAMVTIVTEGNTVTSAPVTWNTTTPAAGSYDPAVTTEQTVTLNGAVSCPDTIDANGAALTTTISITISAADIVGAPMADPATGIYKGKQLVTLTSPTAGAKIYYTTDGSEPAVSGGVPDGTTVEYTAPIAVRGAEGRSVVTTIKAIAVKSGMQASSVETYTYTIQIPDTTLPEVAIEIGTNRWNRFLNTVTFGHFFKNTKKVTITAADNVTSEPEIRYYLSDRQLTAAEIVSAGIEWQAYTEEFNLNANCKKIIYAKATDEAHNAKIVNSEGIVVYTDPAADTTSVIYIKNVTDEVNVQVKLNGNTVAGIKNGEDELTASDYTVDGNGKITLNRVYLSTLETGEYTLTVNYNPMGENYAASNDNEACATTLFTLTVRNPKLTGITQPEAVTGVANGTAKTAAALGLPKTVTITTENPGIITAAVSWNLESLAEGSYEPSVLTEQSFKVNGTVTLPEGVDNSDNKSLTVTIQVTVKAVPGVTAPSITTQPVDAAVKEGETAAFTIAASGTDLTYQWKIDRNDGNGWVNIPGATGTGYTTSTVSLSCNGFKYQCVVSNAAGTVTSDVAVLTVSGSVAYRILDGADSEWKQNTDGTVTIRGNGEFSKFVSVRVDGTLVDEKNYTAREGSTIITLKADYLQTLSVGTHTFEIVWTDGSAETSFKVSENISGNEENRDPDSDNGSSDNHPASPPDGEQDNGSGNGNNEGNHQQITAPKTGDTSHLGVWITLLAFSVAGIIVLLHAYRKQKE